MAKIITTPNPILREISKDIGSLDKKTLAIIRDVQETLSGGSRPRGVGLSAVQIGKPLRVFCLYLPKSGDPDDEKSKPALSTFINPEIIEVSKEKTLNKQSDKSHQPPDTSDRKPILEGCLSIPGIWGPVWRHNWVVLRWQAIAESDYESGTRDNYSKSPPYTNNGNVRGANFAGRLGQSGAAGQASQPWAREIRNATVSDQKIAATRTVTATFSAFPARVIQHELDHLNGILFTDRSVKDHLPVYETKGEKLEEIELTPQALF